MKRLFPLLLSSLLALSAFANDENVRRADEVSEIEKTLFNQQMASANMQELEGRMFQLAELIREAEPENATRLLLALKQSRKDLILEEMGSIQDLLKEQNLSKALGKEKEVLKKLKELRELMVTMDLDFKMKLDRLKKLKQAVDMLDGVIDEQNRQIDSTGEMKDGKPGEGKMGEAKEDQEANRKETDKVKEKVEEAGGSEGAMAMPNLNRAQGNMSDAEGSLGEGKPGGAQQKQKEALDDLKKARDALKGAMKDLQLDLDNRLRAKVMSALMEMLQRQRVVTKQTETLGPKAAEEDANALFGLQRLAKSENAIADICQEILDLIEDTEWSFALPPILESLQRRMTYVSADLKAGRGDEKVIKVEKSIERDLEELLALMDDIPPSDPSEARSDPQKSKERDMNLMLAELRILRMIQLRVNEETDDVDGQRKRAESELTAEMKDRIGSVKDHQYEVYKATAKLHYQFVDPSTYFQ